MTPAIVAKEFDRRLRRAGAIGIFYPIVATREADSPEGAVRALYDPATHDPQAFEHISHPVVKETTTLRTWRQINGNWGKDYQA